MKAPACKFQLSLSFSKGHITGHGADEWVVFDPACGWQLTKQALSSLPIAQSVESPRSFHDLPPDSRPLALKDQACYQLCKALKDDGWVWQRLQKGQSVPYKLEGSKVWYSSGLQISKSYLLCLVQAASNQEIHHGIKVNYYQALLDGDYEGASSLLP